MASLRFLFGMIPATSKVESESDKLHSDFLEYKKFEVSDELKHFQDLEKEVNSTEFLQKIKTVKAQKFNQTEEFKKELEFKQVRKSKPVKSYLKNKDNDSEDAKTLAESPEVKKYLELEKYLNTEKFAETKKYMALSGQQKFELTEEFKKQQEFLQLIKSEKILWYKKIVKKYPFSWVEKWDLCFEDKFEGPKIDSKNWMNRYLNGDKILNKGYVMADDKHAFAEGKNLEIIDKKLRILTRREKAKGLVWDLKLGFYEKEFDFTSDIISTAKSFSQAYGVIEAKVKFGNSGVTQAFSLMSEQMLPHVDIAKFEKGKIFAGSFWKNASTVGKSVSSAGGGKYSADYHIYTLIWEAGKLTWKINGVEFKVVTSSVPDVPLFIVFNSSLKQKADENGIPSAFEIDWVRVYKAK
jgi:beta-glucanase (GH16 family)